NPKRCRIATTSVPESLRSPGIVRLDLHGHDQHRPLDEPEFGRVLAVEMERHSLLEITNRFFDSLSLRDDRDLDALANEPRLIAGPNDRFDRLLELRHESLPCVSHDAYLLVPYSSVPSLSRSGRAAGGGPGGAARPGP